MIGGAAGARREHPSTGRPGSGSHRAGANGHGKDSGVFLIFTTLVVPNQKKQTPLREIQSFSFAATFTVTASGGWRDGHGDSGHVGSADAWLRRRRRSGISGR